MILVERSGVPHQTKILGVFVFPSVGPFVADVVAPTLSSMDPADNATSVSVLTILVMVFSEPIFAGTGNILIKKTTGDATAQTISVTGGQVSITDQTATITLNQALDYSTGYYVTIASGVFTDLALNAYAGISTKTVWNFTTAAPPTDSPRTQTTNIRVGIGF
jgi:hypothetical protein